MKQHQDAGIDCEKVSRTGYPGEDLHMAGCLKGECKARKEAPKTLVNWLGDDDVLFIKPDRQPPLVVMPWSAYMALMEHLPQR